MSLVHALQRGIPLARRPFEELARELGCAENELIAAAARSLGEGTARRFGAVFDARRIGFRSALCCATLADPDSAAALLAPHREVTHCYLREAPGCPNLWWTWSAPAERFDISLASIPFPFRTMPATRRYKIDVVFGGATRASDESTDESLPPPDERERGIIRALQGDTEPRPDYFAAIAEKLGMKEWDLLSTLEIWRRKGRLRRIGLLLNHRRSGYAANGMCCFMVDCDTTVAGRALAELDCVTHCYERPPCEEFPYNLFAMVHGRNLEEAQSHFAALAARLAEAGVSPSAKVMLVSTKEYKKTSLKFYES